MLMIALRLTEWLHVIAQLVFEVILPFNCLFQPLRIDAPFMPSLVDDDVKHINSPVIPINNHFPLLWALPLAIHSTSGEWKL